LTAQAIDRSELSDEWELASDC